MILHHETNRISLICVLNPLTFYWIYRKQEKTKKQWKSFVYLRKIQGVKTKNKSSTSCYGFKYTFSFVKSWVFESSMGSNWQELQSNTWHW